MPDGLPPEASTSATRAVSWEVLISVDRRLGGTGDPLHPGVAPVTVSARAAGQSSMRGGESDKGKSAHKHKAVDAESRQGPLAMPTPTGMHHVG